EHRRSQGCVVRVVPTADVLTEEQIARGQAEKLCERVRELCRRHPGVSRVLLVGAPRPDGAADVAARVVPALRGNFSRMKGEPTDNGYGCLGEGAMPAVAVGRFPARTAEECRAMVAKTLAFEKDTKPGAWKRRLTVLA